MSTDRTTTLDESKRIDLFQTVEKLALEASAKGRLWDMNSAALLNFIRLVSHLHGEHKLLTIDCPSFGGMIRDIKVGLLKGQEWTPWRQPLVDFIVAYRHHYAGSYANGGGAHCG